MADSKYSTVDAKLNSFELPTFNIASESFGVIDFKGALAQLGMALSTVSLDIRLLTTEQGKLGEALASLTAVLSTPRSQLKAFAARPDAHRESQPTLSADIGPRSSSDPPRLALVINEQNHPCSCDLKSLIHTPAEHQTASPMALPGRDKSLGKTLETSQAVEAPKNRAPASADAMDASLDRLRDTVNRDLFGWLSTQIDKLSSLAEENPKLAIVAAVLYPIASRLVEAVIDEAFTNVAKNILKRSAPRQPEKQAPEDERGGAQGDKPSLEKSRKGNIPEPGEGGGDKKREQKPRGKKKRSSPLKQPDYSWDSRNSVVHNVEVQPRSTSPAMTQAQSLVALTGSAQPIPLQGKVAAAGSFLAKRAQPLRVLDAGVGIAQGLAQGDTKTVVSSGGTLAGSYAGASAGAALGTLIFPGVGTAIGGLLGGFAGSELGSMLGEKLGALVDRLDAPAQVSKDLTNTRVDNQPITFNSTIQINGQDQTSARELANLVVQTTLGQLGQLMPVNALATRRDTALTDGVA
ncbi:glycine zipper domain-containing protein [Pseudomonas sp. Sample_24]|uniref:glycine zipper domain-containing protein n=1 Tax=Pseudomonas sp. Sample_24 TaxID=2448268 RepID=UPI001032C4A4|nr:glycine zipper domain-containing protein [Pseudomonas sp. Sample_24]